MYILVHVIIVAHSQNELSVTQSGKARSGLSVGLCALCYPLFAFQSYLPHVLLWNLVELSTV